MEPVTTQTVSNQVVEAFSFFSWAASWHGHVVREATKAFDHVQRSVLQLFHSQARQIETQVRRLPEALVVTSIARMLETRDSSGFFSCLSAHNKEELLQANPSLINKLVRAHKGDLDAIPSVWKQALQARAFSVHSLDLHDIPLRPIYIKKIVQLFPNLKELNLDNCSLTDQCIYYLRNTGLKTLKFDKNNEITEFGINWLSRLSQAQKIDLPPFTYSVDLLSELFAESLGKRAVWYPLPKTLEHLSVYCDTYPLGKSLKQFFSLLKKHCPQLKSVTSPENIIRTQDIVDGLKTLTSLEKIALNFYHFTDAQLSALTSLVHLKILEIKSSLNRELTNASFASFAKFQELEELVVTGLRGVTAEGIDALSALPNFRSLTLSTWRLNNNGLNAIAKLRRLQIVDLSGSWCHEEISPETMTAFGGLPELHTLCIPLNLFQHASCFVKVQKLKLEAIMSVKDAELVSLQEMPELTELEITRCSALTDQALTTLAGCRKLKKVKLTGSHFTAKALAHFQLARPDIKILI